MIFRALFCKYYIPEYENFSLEKENNDTKFSPAIHKYVTMGKLYTHCTLYFTLSFFFKSKYLVNFNIYLTHYFFFLSLFVPQIQSIYCDF